MYSLSIIILTRSALQSEFCQVRVISWSWFARVPMKLALLFLDGNIIDTGMTIFHEPILIKLPIFVTMSTEPISSFVVVFVAKSNSDAIVTVSPNLFDEAVTIFRLPLVGEKSCDFVTSVQELRSIAPNSVLGVRHLYLNERKGVIHVELGG